MVLEICKDDSGISSPNFSETITHTHAHPHTPLHAPTHTPLCVIAIKRGLSVCKLREHTVMQRVAIQWM